MQWAQTLKQEIETRTKKITVIIARRTGHVTETYHTAQLANGTPADLVLSLHAYHHALAPCKCTLYHFSRNDEFITPPRSLAFCPYDRAHLYCHEKTALYAHSLHEILVTHESLQGTCTVYPPNKLPIKQLVGIATPALLIEIGIDRPSQWDAFVEPLVQWIIHTAAQTRTPSP